MEEAEVDLKYFRGLANAPAYAAITGVVFDPQRTEANREITLRKGARVSLKGEGVEKSAVTDASASFVLRI